MQNPGTVNPESFRLPLVYYRSHTRYPQLSDVNWPLPEQLDEIIEALGGGHHQGNRFDEVARSLNVTPDELREASRFFVRQVLFAPNGDFYRVLGVEPGAATEEIKQRHRLLIRIFHPDRPDAHDWEKHFANRINEAWSTLRDRRKRRGYDRKLGSRRIHHHAAPSRDGGSDPRARGFSQPPASGKFSPKAGEILYRSRLWNSKPSVVIWGAIILIAATAALLAVLSSRHVVPPWNAAGTRPPPDTRTEHGAPVAGASASANNIVEEGPSKDRVADAGHLSASPDSTAEPGAEGLISRTSSASGQIGAEPTPKHARAAPLPVINLDKEPEAVVPTPPARQTEDESVVGQTVANADATLAPTESRPSEKAPDTSVQEVSPTVPPPPAPSPESTDTTDTKAAVAAAVAAIPRAAESVATRKPTKPEPPAITKKSPVTTQTPSLPPAEADNKRIKSISPSAAPVPDEKSAQTASAVAASPSPPAVNAPVTGYGDISKLELNMLLARFIAAYENGDLKRFTRVFSRNVSLNDGEGYRALRRSYGSLFENTNARRMALNDINWIVLDDTHLKGWARTNIELWPTSKEGAERFTGKIILVVEKKGDKLQITRFNHHMTSQ